MSDVNACEPGKRPPYPVAVRDPLISTVIKNFSTQDWATTAGFGLAAYPYGWFFAKGMRRPTAVCASVIALGGGFCFSYIRSCARLTGMAPNDAEVAKYGSN
mmetsp:Transcript_12561/g.29360  ORF Transcript_12561/g.29360 Transcript_12561/m.29360 type:complete len:102 (-) Transcript_12561:47-352(-)